jgi:DNA helicase-2/ATP-dependent DNA helicase PcrA
VELSFSRYRIYRECPWKYKLQFVDRRRAPMDAPSSLGVSLHRALERFHRARATELSELLEFYESEFLRSGYKDAAERDQWFEKGRRILKKYIEAEQSRRTEVLGNEREFIYPLGKHTVRGMIDRIDKRPDGKIEVIDYKTRFEIGGSDPLPAEVSDLQLRFYALGVKECFGYEPALLTIHYLAAGKTETKPYDPSGEEALKADMLRVADLIERQQYPPDTSFCPRCVYRSDCSYSAAKEGVRP